MSTNVITTILATAAVAGAVAASGAAEPQPEELTVRVTRAGSLPSSEGPASWFTGRVRIDPLFATEAPARVAGATVTFEPGARTAWHTHPLGQTLIVQQGLGLVQRAGGPIEEIRPGDAVWIPAGVKHWHGASPRTAMVHLAVQESLDGAAVEWLEQVSDTEYPSASSGRPAPEVDRAR